MGDQVVKYSESRYNDLPIESSDQLEAVKIILSDPSKISRSDIALIIDNISHDPRILDYLSLSEFSTMSKVGIDLSPYVTDVKVNNIRSLTFKMVTSNMERISYQYEVLMKLESRFYDDLLERDHITDQSYLMIIDNLRSSVDSTMNQMMKLADSESIMAMMYVELGNVKSELDDIDSQSSNAKIKVLSKGSKEKILSIVSKLSDEVNKEGSDESTSPINIDDEVEIIDVEVDEPEVRTAEETIQSILMEDE